MSTLVAGRRAVAVPAVPEERTTDFDLKKLDGAFKKAALATKTVKGFKEETSAGIGSLRRERPQMTLNKVIIYCVSPGSFIIGVERF